MFLSGIELVSVWMSFIGFLTGAFGTLKMSPLEKLIAAVLYVVLIMVGRMLIEIVGH